MKQKFMTSKEVKVFLKQIEEQFGKVPDIKKNAFVKSKERIYMVNRDVDKIDLDQLNINSVGLYIAEVKHGLLRLSIEGSQLIGPTATKNVLEISEEQLKEWFKGNDFKVEGEFEGFVILKYEKDYVGSGKYKEGKILNFVPKNRRLIEIH